MGITAEDNLAVFLRRQLQKAAARVVPPVGHSQKVHFQRNATVFCFPEQAGHFRPVYFVASNEVNEIRVGKVGEKPGLHGIFCLAAVIFQNLGIFGGRAAVYAVRFTAGKMLPQQQIGNGGVPQDGGELRKISGIVFRFQTDLDLYFPGVFFLKLLDAPAVPRQLGHPHPEGGQVSSGERVGGMVGKTQNFQATLHCGTDIPVLPGLGMVTPPGVGVVICDHGVSSFGCSP